MPSKKKPIIVHCDAIFNHGTFTIPRTGECVIFFFEKLPIHLAELWTALLTLWELRKAGGKLVVLYRDNSFVKYFLFVYNNI